MAEFAYKATDSTGKTVRLSQLDGKVFLIAYVYTTCPRGCAEVVDQMRAMQAKFGNDPRFHLVSVSLNPSHDTPEQLAQLSEVAHRQGYAVHVDGARFANAVAATMGARGIDAAAACRALSVDAGVDALSFGGTKNGLALGEAVLYFARDERPAVARACVRFPFLRKSTGHLLSKHRYVTAPFAAALEGGAWLRHAAHANRMAARLAAGLRARGLEPAFPCEANGVFVDLPEAIDRRLRSRGHGYYPFASPVGVISRLMCSFDTSADDVDALLSDLDRP